MATYYIHDYVVTTWNRLAFMEAARKQYLFLFAPSSLPSGHGMNKSYDALLLLLTRLLFQASTKWR